MKEKVNKKKHNKQNVSKISQKIDNKLLKARQNKT